MDKAKYRVVTLKIKTYEALQRRAANNGRTISGHVRYMLEITPKDEKKILRESIKHLVTGKRVSRSAT